MYMNTGSVAEVLLSQLEQTVSSLQMKDETVPELLSLYSQNTPLRRYYSFFTYTHTLTQ